MTGHGSGCITPAGGCITPVSAYVTPYMQAIGVRDVEVDPAVSPVGVSPDGMLLDDLAVDLGEQEMKELFMNHEDSGCDGEEVGGLPRSKRPHLEDPLDRDSNPQLTHHAHAHQTGL